MATDIGPKIGLDGEKEFRAALQSMGQQLKTLDTEMRAVTSAFSANDKSQAALSAQSDVLTKKLSTQEARLAEIQKALDYARANYAENSNEVQRWQQALNNATADVNKTKAQLAQLDKGLGDTEDALNDAGKQAASFGDVLKANLLSNIILDGVKQLASAVKSMAGEFISSAAEVKAETSAFDQTFGNLGDTASAAIGRVAAESGILQTRLNTLGSKIYAFARSSGGDTEQSMALMERALRAAADSAAYYDTSVEQATETLQSFLKGNFANDAALGLSATETTRNAAAMELFGDKYANLTEIQKQETLLKMVEDSQRLSGAMGQAAREADGWENVTGNLKETWRQFQAQAGTPFLENLIPLIQKVTAESQAWIDGVDWDGFAATVTNFVSLILDNGDTIIALISGIGAGFVAWNVVSMVMGLVKAIQAAQKANEGMTAAQAALNVVMNANPIGAVITVVAALTATVITLWHTNEDFRDAVIAIWDKVKAVFAGVGGAAKELFTQTIPNAVRTAVDTLGSLPGKALQWGKDLIDNFINGIKSKLSALADSVKGVAQTVRDFIGFSEPKKGPLSNFHTYAPDMMSLFAGGIRDNLWKVQDQLNSMGGNIQDAIPTPAVDAVYNAAAGMVNGLAAANAGSSGGSYTINLVLQNGQQIASWLLPDLRDAARNNPEVATA